MTEPARGGLGSMLAWMAYPLAPALLATAYRRALDPAGNDPRLWSGWEWPIQLGPLAGYAFLAAATAGVPDPEGFALRRPRTWLARRSLWVAVGPWAGFLACVVGRWALEGADRLARWLGATSPTPWQ